MATISHRRATQTNTVAHVDGCAPVARSVRVWVSAAIAVWASADGSTLADSVNACMTSVRLTESTANV